MIWYAMIRHDTHISNDIDPFCSSNVIDAVRYVYIYIYIERERDTHISLYMYIYMCIYTYIYIYIHTYIRMCAYLSIYM